MKKVAILCSFLFLAVYVSAEYDDNWKILSNAKMSVDDRVEQATELLVKKLSLEENQIAEISKIQREAALNFNEIQVLKADKPEIYAQKELNIVTYMDRKIAATLKEKQSEAYKRILKERASNNKLEIVKQREAKAKLLPQNLDKN